MDRWTPPVHQYISMTPPVNVIPGWMINNTITHLIDPNLYSESPERQVVCHDFDPYCFAPYIDGFHGHLAFGRLGLPKLKLTLTKSRNEKEISLTLNTLCDLLHDPEKAAEAMRLNLLFQLRRLLGHDSWYVRQRTAYALKVLSGQQTGRVRVVDDDRLMAKIIDSMKDPSPSVRRTVYDLIHRLTTYYFAVPKLLEYGFIKIIIAVLRENFLGEELAVEEESARDLLVVHSSKNFRSEEEVEAGELEEEMAIDAGDSMQNVEEPSEKSDECPIDDKNICVLVSKPYKIENVDPIISIKYCNKTALVEVTLMDALLNLMSFNREATLDAICYDVLKLKLFFSHENQTVRILTWNIFKQIFTTDVGQLSMVPHNILEDMMRAFSNDLSPMELEEVAGTLMLALIKVENRAAALEWGVLDKVLNLAKQPNLSPGKRIAALNVLSHLAELPDVRTILQGHLLDVAISINMDYPDLEHHAETHIERVLWKP